MEEFGELLFRCRDAERPGGVAVQAEPPARRASRRINAEDTLGEWASSLGLRNVNVHRIVRQVPLTLDNAWDLVLGSGFRAMVFDLDEKAADRVRERFLEALDTENVGALDASSLVAVGTLSVAPPVSTRA